MSVNYEPIAVGALVIVGGLGWLKYKDSKTIGVIAITIGIILIFLGLIQY